MGSAIEESVSVERTVKLDAKNNGYSLGSINITAGPPAGNDYIFYITRGGVACGYTISVYSSPTTGTMYCTAGVTDSNYSTTYTKEGRTSAEMTTDGQYYITVTRVFGSTAATVMNYSGTKLFNTSDTPMYSGSISSSGSGNYGPFNGTQILFKNGQEYKLSLTLSAK